MIEILEDAGLDYRLGPVSTAVEGDWEQIMSALHRCHQTMCENHKRVITTITIDDRREQPHHLDEMVDTVARRLGHAPKNVKQKKEAAIL
jgi:uncharacterized protein (TIGR00106 family)